MLQTLARKPTSRIGEILVRREVISREQLTLALERQRAEGQGRLGDHLLALGYVDEKGLTEHLAIQFDLPVVDPAEIEVHPEALQLVPPQHIQKNQILPVSLSGSKLTVVVADPLDTPAINEIRFLTGYDVKIVLAPPGALRRRISRLLDDGSVYRGVLERLEMEFDVLDEAQTDIDLGELQRQSEEGPVVALVNAVLEDAVRKRASDVHIEPFAKFLRVRFRIDGMLREIMQPPLRLRSAITSRIKVMARLDIAEHRAPQDGRIRIKAGPGHEIDVRVSVVQTLAGEKVVMRLLDKANLVLDLAQLGYSDRELAIVRSTIRRPQGMVLVTGPTGSGKTTTLYGILNEINDLTVNVSTVEDPVEYEVPGVNQVAVEESAGRGFAEVLRALLRQDPDVIMVGEVRDRETGEIALRAALTGHLVLSTLHTNDAPSTIARLVDMGFEPFLLASALELVVAQRLIRRLCTKCRHPVEADPNALLDLGIEEGRVPTLFGPRGCDDCFGTGYAGRLAVHEILAVDEQLRPAILGSNDGGARVRTAALEAGMKTLRESAVERMLEGTTSLDEVMRVTVEG